MHKTIWLFGALIAVSLLPSVGMAQQPVRWEPTLESAQRLAGQSNRLVIIHFWAPWCGVCKRMESEILTQSPVVAELTTDYVPVKINADHFPATAKQYGVTALPTTVIITPQGQMLDSMKGWVDATEYVARLSRVAADAKQHSAIYAQVPPATAPTTSAAPTAIQVPSPTSPPPIANASPSGMSGPSLGANTLPATAARQPAGNNSDLTDDRYADFFRRNEAGPATPIAQPSQAVQPPADYATPTPPVAAPANVPAPTALTNQPYPLSQPSASGPQAAAVGPAYGSQSPQMATQQSASVSPANPVIPSPAGGTAQQLPVPAINPPLALDGYCPVSLAEKQEWVLGDRRWGAKHRGRIYLFVGPEEQRRFFADPDRYAPAISGNDVVLATEQGQAVPGMREHGVFFANRVYLFSSEANLEKFAGNPGLYANQAMGSIRGGAFAGQSLP